MSKKKSAYDLRKIYEQIEFDLISSMRRNLKRHEAEEEKEGFKWEQWQAAKLRNLSAYRAENQKIVQEAWQEVRPNFRKMLKDAFKQGFNRLSTIFRKPKIFEIKVEPPENGQEVQKDVPFEKQQRRPEKSFFVINDKKLEALEKTVENDLNKANKAIWRRMDDIYKQTVFNAQIHMASGAKTLDQAIDLATENFLKSGINCIEYKNGARVNIASYVEMALRTASHRATLLGEGKGRDKYGVYTVVVSAHANTCPLCEKWQGKILIDDTFTSLAENPAKAAELSKELGYPLVSGAIEAGLLHPNCRHSLITYFPGVTNLPKVPDGKEAIKKYEAEQEQRRLERLIRKWKRIEKGSLGSENADKAKKEVGKYQQLLREHLKRHEYLRRNYSREKDRNIPVDKSLQAKELISKAKQAEPKVTADLKEISETTGSSLEGLEYRLKSEESLSRKLENSDGKSIRDVLRYTYISKSADYVNNYKSTVAILESKGYNVSAVKNYWLRSENPYNGINTFIKTESGYEFEIQYHTQESFDLKMGELHGLYEKARLLDETSKEHEKLTKTMFELSSSLDVPKGIQSIEEVG